MSVSDRLFFFRFVPNKHGIQRGEHRIDDELVFSNHKGYVFHDSRGLESGGAEELAILQEFIRRKCHARLLRDRLHAIWFESSGPRFTTTVTNETF